MDDTETVALSPIDFLKLSADQRTAVRQWVELHGHTTNTVAHIRVVGNTVELVVIDEDLHLPTRVTHRVERCDLRAPFPAR